MTQTSEKGMENIIVCFMWYERRNYNTPMYQQGTFGLLLIVAANYLILPTTMKYIWRSRPNGKFQLTYYLGKETNIYHFWLFFQQMHL